MFGQLFRNKRRTDVIEQPTLNESITYPSMTRKDELFERDLEQLRLKYRMGQIPKINAAERGILEFCHQRDMKEFLREEFEKHPIVLDEDGGLVGENPFEKERRMKAAIAPSPDNSNYEIL